MADQAGTEETAEAQGGGTESQEETTAASEESTAAESTESTAVTTESTEETARTSPTSWREQVTDPDLRKIADRFNSPQDAIKAVADLRKRESTSIRIPGENATDEERAAYRKAIGVPEKPEQYAFVMPEGREANDVDKAFQNHFAQVFHKFDIPAHAAKGLNDEWNKFIDEAAKVQAEADKSFAKATMDALKQEWGDDFERNNTLATRAAQEILGKDFEAATQIETKDGRLLLDHPIMMRAFASIGSEMAEGRLGPSMGDSERASIQDRIDDLQNRKMEAMDKGDRRTASRLDAEQQALYSKLEGDAPIVGSQGRTA